MYDSYDLPMIEQPLDILFALEKAASDPPPELVGMIDADRAGVTGYSFDGYNTFLLSGARINPAFYLAQCVDPDETFEREVWFDVDLHCPLAGEWQEFEELAGKEITESDDGLWRPVTDPRIRAVAPLAGDGWWLFGKEGVTAITKPTLILISTKDVIFAENQLIFKTLGTDDKAMIAFIDKDHLMVYDREIVAQMAHFLVAFFGTQLQGRQDLAQYYSEDFISGYGDLRWEDLP